MLTLLVGGARSGKSTLAVRMAERQPAPVTFIATAEPFDDDLRERVTRHRAERPAEWTTVECPLELADAIRRVADDQFLIVDCLTVWLGNLVAHVGDAPTISRYGHDTNEALRARHGVTVVVTNEVGMGVHPETAIGREYRDELGRLNQSVAAIADTTLLLVAGRAVRLDDPWELLE
ncbi:MAG: adenosylcobinamide kinase/adenosylcobinamide-phosphate guanylyltransferase [Actinomycetota bacterium]|jgi:adenosyl cobinamide kinase/adenosyl cobinamide phosphate guanylyltransferase